MGEIRITPAATAGGPLADGSAHDILTEWLDESKRKIADYAVGQLKSVHMDKTGRATGRYQSMIETRVLTYNDLLIRDPVVYGMWLEGVSERNRSTRFKGYRLWRRAKSATEQQKTRIAEETLPPYLDRIGGRP